jgi:hypothetical protein
MVFADSALRTSLCLTLAAGLLACSDDGGAQDEVGQGEGTLDEMCLAAIGVGVNGL